MTIEDLQNAIRAGRVRITDHADEEALADRLSYDEIETSVLAGSIIEEYATLRPYPSYLVCGPAEAAGWVHSVWAYNEANRWSIGLILPSGLTAGSGGNPIDTFREVPHLRR
jgi:hypothetical protein